MSTCPRELQAMLHVCQEWSIRNRMQINTQKTKVMAFFETPSLQKARGGQHRPGPTLPPFHIHAPFPISSPCSYLITEVLQFEYLGLILDPKLTMHLATIGDVVLSRRHHPPPQARILVMWCFHGDTTLCRKRLCRNEWQLVITSILERIIAVAVPLRQLHPITV